MVVIIGTGSRYKLVPDRIEDGGGTKDVKNDKLSLSQGRGGINSQRNNYGNRVLVPENSGLFQT